MTEALPLALAWFAGALLGAAFYGGLWWTVQRGVVSPRPGLWFFASLVLRTGIALTGLWLIGAGRWQHLLLALLGFVMARPLVVRVARRRSARCTSRPT